MRRFLFSLALALLVVPLHAQTKKAPARRPAQTRKAPAKPVAPPPLTRVPATMVCPSELGDGVATKRRFCDVLAGLEPERGIVITIPPHRGEVTLSFELHNRHTYSADLVAKKQAYRHYTATVGVLLMDLTIIDRAAIDSEFRTAKDFYDRIAGGAGPGGLKAVAPTGAEFVQMALPTGTTAVSILGEKLTEVRPDATSVFTSPGRPIATISNVMIEYRPGTALPARPPAKKGP